MTRRDDWHAQLMNAVETAALLPFSYGLHDCCTFAAHCVDAMCGTELVSRMQRDNPYSDEASAYREIEREGGFAALVSKYLGASMPNPLLAAPGDIALCMNGEREIVGVIVGHTIVAPGGGGLVSLPYDSMVAAWKV